MLESIPPLKANNVTTSSSNDSILSFNLPVSIAQDFRVISGANLGDGLTADDNVVLADIYKLRNNAETTRIAVCPSTAGDVFTVARNSVVGTPGATLHLNSCLTFMHDDGTVLEVIVLVEVVRGLVSDTYILPLSPIHADQEYTLVTIDRESVLARFADISCVSFTRGTHVMLADGEQTLIETLWPGDLVMTRDHGPQPLKWVGQQTVRAEGEFAPIVIRRGALNNTNDLTLGPNHRLFIYQRNDEISVGQSEVTVQAKLLVNGDDIVQSSGGFIDYFQLLFEDHQVIYVESIAAESMMVDMRNHPTLPTHVKKGISLKSHSKRDLNTVDINPTRPLEANLAEILKRASV